MNYVPQAGNPVARKASGMGAIQSAVQPAGSTATKHAPYRPSLPTIALLALTAVVFYPVAAGLVRAWSIDPNSSHGFAIPVFSAWVVWRHRSELQPITSTASFSGLILVAFALLLMVVGTIGAEQFLPGIALVLLLGGYVATFLGWNAFRRLLFPWALLFLMVPIPSIVLNQITLPLQVLSSQLATSLLSLIGIPVLREGNVITLPVMKLEVAEACSGIRSLISLTTLVVMYGYLAESSWVRRVVLALAAIPIAVAANALRIFGTGVCVEYWDPTKAVGFFHGFSGWALFMVSVALVLLVHAMLCRIGDALTPDRGRPA